MSRNKFLILIFALFLALPTLDSIFNFSPVKELFEKRISASKPKFSFDKTYPKNFENFFNDNYGLRRTLIKIHSEMMDDVFDESPDARAVIGKGGWLYFDNHNSLLDASGKAQISDELIKLGVESFGRNWQEMRKRNIKYLLVIAADKSSIYPEFLPDYIKVGSDHRIDKFLSALKKSYPDFPVLDLRPILLEAKKKEVIYQQTDTHWNRRGAHFAYVEMMKMLKIKAHLRSEFSEKSDEIIRGDISDIMGVNATNVNLELEPKFSPKSHIVLAKGWSENKAFEQQMKGFYHPTIYLNLDKNLPSAFVYKDSFFADLSSFTAEHFSLMFTVNEFPCDLDFERIKKFHPDVVIQEFWEGRIEVVLKSCF